MSDAGSKQPEYKGLPIFYPSARMICTKSMYFYLFDFAQIIDLFVFTVELAATADEYAERAANALVAIDKGLMLAKEIGRTIQEFEARRDASLEKIKTDGASKRLEEYILMDVRHLITSLMDSFLTYVSRLIQSTLKKNPSTLNSSEMIRIDDLLEFKKNKDLINFFTVRKINELSYGGVRKIEEYTKDRFGIDMFKDDKSRKLLIIFVELRNIYVHNRGYVNDVFLSRIKDSCGFTFEKGQRYKFNFSELCRLVNNCAEVATRLDGIMSSKFHLERKKYANWKKKSPRFV